ncbi:MAG: hypothetical protein M1834_003938 [Cirrosporium novae-zelandiae]|nr:MAG: hypothetical protein M1834_003938 [Cirrosporium novae-zelandiae]
MSLPTRTLGRGGPKVTALGCGLMSLGGAYATQAETDEERFKFLDHAYSLGALLWDTADIYGDCEDVLGKWFKQNPEKRKNIFLCTKFGIKSLSGTDSSPEYCKEACAKSLKRLGVEGIDLYYNHRVDGKTPIEKTVEAMVKLKNEGKIKYLGLSECSSETLRRAYKIHPISAVQIEYSPFSMDIENPKIGLLKTCRELGVTVIAYSPLGRGFLTGTVKTPDDIQDQFRKMSPRFSPENFPKNLKLVEEVKTLADKKGCTPSQLVLAWLMAQGDDIIPIPGTRRTKYLEENLGALKVKLAGDENNSLRKAVDAAEVGGDRYPAMMTENLFGDTPVLWEMMTQLRRL